MKCSRCGQKFEYPGFQTDICGSCADELRDEKDSEEAEKSMQQEGDLLP